MLELKRNYDSFGRAKFVIKTNEGPFRIYYGSDLSLYWSCSIPNSEDVQDSYKYTITKENKHVYSIFYELYDSIMIGLPFKHFRYGDNENYIYYNDNGLVNNGAVEWHSDDFSYDAASVLRIEKDTETENFIVSFNKSKVAMDDLGLFSTYTVKISTGECRYDPYNATFLDMYRKLSDYCEQRGNTFSKNNSSKRRRLIR